MQKNNYNDVSIAEYLELRELQSIYEGIELIQEIVAYVLDIDPLLIEEYSIRELNEIYENNQWVNELPVDINKSNITSLSIGKFIDLNALVTEKADSNITDILDILEIEYDLYSTPITNVYHHINSFIEYRTRIINAYPSYFIGEPDGEEEIDPATIVNARDRMLYEQQLKRDKAKAELQWHALIFELCDYDLTKVDSISNLPTELIFNALVTRKLFRPHETKTDN